MLDASAAVEWLLGRPGAQHVAERITAAEVSIHAPSFLGVEVAQALRRLIAGGHMSDDRGQIAISDLTATGVALHDPDVLLNRIWDLRNNLSAYDAAYVALAEVLGATLLTADARISRAPGTNATVEVITID
ncbi:MAG TPA: type II toxin-antitoxin system VapC family toxin [Beutenbergiaceae bacterium]|nr:type II toxin-antitoxin system VapC family toxin [Beutenbergiaceae bacterium]